MFFVKSKYLKLIIIHFSGANQIETYILCGKKYVGETSMKTATRIQQHKKSIVDKNGT